jgi:23S rRNA (adenine2503-C2)-methyltransferase
MGEPSLNDSILAVLENLKNLYDAPGLLISFSTIAPARREKFFTRLLDIKDRLFQGRFQFQFSLHTTDNRLRRWLVPCRTWSFEQMAEYGKIFRKSDDKKITLNFALAREMPLETSELLKFFDPDDFLIKITPVNPTFAASKNRIRSLINNKQDYGVIELLKSSGYEVILSIGEPEENLIGSNCGQYIEKFKQERKKITGGYTYFSP